MCCEKAHESGQSSLILDRKTEWVPADKPAAAGTQSGASRGEPGNLNWVDHRAGPETGPHNNTASIHKPTHGRLQQVGFLPASLPLLSFLINHQAHVLPDRCDIYIYIYMTVLYIFFNFLKGWDRQTSCKQSGFWLCLRAAEAGKHSRCAQWTVAVVKLRDSPARKSLFSLVSLHDFLPSPFSLSLSLVAPLTALRCLSPALFSGPTYALWWPLLGPLGWTSRSLCPSLSFTVCISLSP